MGVEMKFKILAGAALLASAVAPAHAAGVTFLSDLVEAGGVSNASYDGTAANKTTSGTTTATSSAFGFATGSYRDADASGQAKSNYKTTSAAGTLVNEEATANLSSVYSGDVTFIGSTTASTKNASAKAYANAQGFGDTFDYQFKASKIGKGATITVDWDTFAISVGNPSTGSWLVYFDGLTVAVGANATGSATFNLVKGVNELTITEINSVDYAGVVGKNGKAAGTNNSQFSFAIAGGSAGPVPGVPEVSTWAMMLAGFAVIGLVGVGRNNRPRVLEG
jgi:hypothetical protein